MTPEDPLLSEFAGDPEMADLIEEFVAGLPGQVAILEGALARSDVRTLAVVAHQLKGSAGGYGFQPITALAGAVEAEAGIQSEGKPGDREQLSLLVEDLAALCRRAVAATVRDPGS